MGLERGNTSDRQAISTLSSLTLSGNLNLAAASNINWSGRSIITSGSDGTVNITNAAATSGFRLSGTTDGVLTVQSRTGSTGYMVAAGFVINSGGTSGLDYNYSGANQFRLGSVLEVVFTNGTASGGTRDVGIARGAAGLLKLTDGLGTAASNLQIGAGLTAATMTAEQTAQTRDLTQSFTWTNAMVTALGASTTGDIKVCTLPAKTVVVDCMLQVVTAETALTSLTGSVGFTAATYVDYILAGSLKAAANTFYGDAAAERGATLGFSLPSYTGTTDVYMHLISGVENLSTALACTGRVILTTRLLP